MDMKVEMKNAFDNVRDGIADQLQSKHDAEVAEAREAGRLEGIAQAGGEIPVPVGFTQEQVDAIVAEKEAPLLAEIQALKDADVLEDAQAASLVESVRTALAQATAALPPVAQA